MRYVDLYQPSQDVLRFHVANQRNYRLYTYRARQIGDVPPPGECTDHKFTNIKGTVD